MELLKQRIMKDGHVKPGNIIKVDSFLNHQMDIELMNEIGKEFAHLFADQPITKILTIEASGIGIAAIAAQHFGNVPVVFAKKTKSKNLDGELYISQVESFTRNTVFDIQVSKKFITEDDCVLILDDFLARGKALLGLIDIVNQSGAKFAGCGIVIEKGWQDGGEVLRKKGVRLESLAIIDKADETGFTFRN
ncbi:xanthine phosphoribosyltransferase [Hydrogenoanaerobacterium saccharovorans]|uniref:Xanthine phosphoribosyltransferase n=1 Tax=Hydrogenoanaerobacterium saccharovorans TaxID=474960 RepID=A0A1H8AST5_9FIRM|nr:xanthine phosphoribosyltransferase [Hydrogenoanaerobacterium saccharovorans]RPF47801.1 xanthine phosphoribosyltransferase [Hydrogenoanaerobacterium saccharovorans]SEM73024.1 xanthine phosphoribosyltransferase [Hydrogenoanaerobacterium saccharovorans]